MSDLKYILYQDETNNGSYQLGFNRFNTPGYIDYGFGWTDESREEFDDKVICELSDFIETHESYSFSHAVIKLEGLEEKLKAMGIPKQEQQW